MITVLAVLGRLMRPGYDEGPTAATQAAAAASHDSLRSTQGYCPPVIRDSAHRHDRDPAQIISGIHPIFPPGFRAILRQGESPSCSREYLGKGGQYASYGFLRFRCTRSRRDAVGSTGMA